MIKKSNYLWFIFDLLIWFILSTYFTIKYDDMWIKFITTGIIFIPVVVKYIVHFSYSLDKIKYALIFYYIPSFIYLLIGSLAILNPTIYENIKRFETTYFHFFYQKPIIGYHHTLLIILILLDFVCLTLITKKNKNPDLLFILIISTGIIIATMIRLL
jgi:hypothetical protein